MLDFFLENEASWPLLIFLNTEVTGFCGVEGRSPRKICVFLMFQIMILIGKMHLSATF